MAEIPIFETDKTSTAVQFGAGASAVLREQANASERLTARLQGGVRAVQAAAAPIITEETQKRAIKDVKAGRIDSKSVALVAQDVYRRTAENSFMADVEVGAKELGTNLVNEQTLSGNYDTNAINASWNSYIKGSTSGIKDITVKSNIENRLAKMGQQFQAQVATLQTNQQRKLQQKNLTAKLEMDTNSLKASIGVNAEDTLQLQTEIATTLKTLVDANMISAEEATNLHTGINKEAYLDQQQREFKKAMVAGKGEEFIKKFDKSKQPLLDETEKLAKINSFESQMSELRRDAKNAKTAQDKTFTLDVDEGIKVLNSGKVPDDKIVLDEKVKSLSEKKQRQYQVATIVQSVISKFKDYSLPEMEAYINSAEATEITDIYGVEVFDEAKKVIAQKQKLAKADPLSLAVQEGLFEQPEAVTITDLAPLAERLQLSAVTSSQYGTAPRLLTSAEATVFSNYMEDPTVTIGEKQNLIANINAQGTEIAENVYRQVGGKKAYNFAFAGELAAIGNDKASTLALQGRNADVTLEADYKVELQQKLKGVFNNFSAEFFNQNLQGLKDYTKGLIVTGQDVDIDDVLENTIGISLPYNTKQTILPYNVSRGDFEAWLDTIEIPNRPDLTEGLQDLTDRTFSGDYQLHYAGPGKYLVWNDNNGNGFYATETDNPDKPFILDWRK